MGLALPHELSTGSTSLIILPWAVLIPDNQRLQRGRRGKFILGSKYRIAKEAAAIHAIHQWRRREIAGPVRVHLSFYLPDQRKRDCTNLFKLIFDALIHVCYADDSQVAIGSWVKQWDKANPRVEITVSRYAA